MNIVSEERSLLNNRQAETFHSKPWFQESSKSYGYDSYLYTEPHDLAPISHLIKELMISKGLPLDDDMFSYGNNPYGCGHAVRTVHQGLRTTGADFITKGGLRAVGVRVVDAKGHVTDIKARKEVIVLGGAYCSPNILNRSGIGFNEELKRHGINTLVNLPAVSKNLQDHLITFIFYETDKPGLTNDHLVHHGDARSHSYSLWKEHKTGFLFSFPFGIFAFARLDECLTDSRIWASAPREKGRDPMGNHVFAIIAELFAPKSRGTVSLRSSDPTATPVVNCNYLSDPLDVEVMAEACRFGNEIIMEGARTKNIIKGSWPPNSAYHKLQTREDWIPYVRDNAMTCFHAAGTCAMGGTLVPKAVVDEQLRVKGVKGLRVADCSVMPLLNSGHTQMPAFGIGEKAADLIKETWSKDTAKL
ncbi:hypothetical protein EDB81DRAFT_774026 [Dactylonectria macrodidyma]|uniref:Glucose-methanol-choline oxidoreductase N-terminal domain-containing protein n=1 Tax=Dactylonectria macrodidyma TaxID=307937 RepID=A0A9P9JGQ7_9HYPO|nr:hypothetical protein EDB81DRAFT_774026 [Dactylonectria macrodidyma]